MSDHLPVPSTVGRRVFLGVAAGTAVAVTLPAWPARAAVTAVGTPVYETHPPTEPSGTHARDVDGTQVLFSYGTVVPSFDGWRTHQPERTYVSLDGSWRFAPDPDATGIEQGWHTRAFNDRRWSSIPVPSAWDLLDTPGFGSLDGTRFGEGTAFLDGYGWYRRDLTVPVSLRRQHLRLQFLAVGYSADVWLDGVYLGKHEGASAAFSMPVVGDVPRGRATLAVRVYRRASYPDYASDANPVTDDRAVPWKPVDYWPYAGITRSVWLEAVPSTSIAKVLVSAVPGEVDLRVVVTNHGAEPFTGTVLANPDRRTGARASSQRVTVAAGSVRVVRFTFEAPDAPTWSVDDPQLMTARVSLDVTQGRRIRRVDSLTATYGVREIRTQGNRLELNGSPLFLKGTSWHEETARHGRAMTRAEYNKELGHVLDLGANFIRNCVYTRDPYVYEWADRNGVLIMDDLDTMWLNTAQEQLQTAEYGLCRAMAFTAGWNQHNHPSVILWGLQNESEIDAGEAPVYRAWISDMLAAVRSVDLSARPVTWASSTTNDPAFDLADVIGFNEYFGYFYGKSSDLGPAIDAVHAAHPDKPILITENGTWAIAGQHGSADVQGTEEWQAGYIEEHWAQVSARSDYVAGYTLWVLKDYKERAGYNQAYNGVSVLGLLSFDTQTPKLAYSAFQKL